MQEFKRVKKNGVVWLLNKIEVWGDKIMVFLFITLLRESEKLRCEMNSL